MGLDLPVPARCLVCLLAYTGLAPGSPQKNLRVPRSFVGNTVYGATVTFGDPLKVSSMPTKEATATDKLFEALLNIRKKA